MEGLEEIKERVSIRTLLIAIFYLCVSFGAIAFLMQLRMADGNAFRVVHHGTIPVVQDDAQKVAAAYQAMMPLRQNNGGAVTYVEVTEGCNSAYYGSCVNLRSGPGMEYPAVAKLRKGIVLRVEKTVRVGFRDWYKIQFDEFVRYPERLGPDLYIASDAVKDFTHDPPAEMNSKTDLDSPKRIVVDLSDQKLYAYDGETLFMEEPVSTGLDGTPTQVGGYFIFRKTPSRYMQGPIPGQTSDEYDLPGVPWTMYFTEEGAAIHGAYWHNEFGQQHSHGCVNLSVEKAKQLYEWAPLGTLVIVRD